MVDGADVGTVETFSPGKLPRGSSLDPIKSIQQDFRDAEMVVIDVFDKETATADESKEYKDNKCKKFNIYGIYGNKIVTSSIEEDVLYRNWAVIKNKTVLATRKPYLLNGDQTNN